MLNQTKNSVYFPYLLIALLCLLLYLKTLFFGLTFFDDDFWVGSSKHGLQNIASFIKVFLSIDISGVYYRPMITLSFLLDSWLSNFCHYSFRITNILLHFINSCLVFILFKKLRYKEEIALSFALIFTVHPALVQAVAWIPGRTDSLLSVFVLLAFINFVLFLDTDRKINFIQHCLFFFLALLTKETALMLPVVCLLYVFLIGTKNKFSVVRKTIFPWLTVVLIWFLLRQFALGGQKVLHSGMIATFFDNLPAVILYFGKTLLPINLSVQPILADSNLWIGTLAVLIIAGLLGISKKKRFQYIIFGLCWFLFFLFPAFITSVFPEYRVYTAIIGVFILLHETIITEFFQGSFLRNLLGAGGVVVLFFAIASHVGDIYKNRISFWGNAVLYSSSLPTSHVNLAYAYFDKGELDKAKAEFEKTLILVPQAPTVYHYLAIINYKQGNFKLAEENLRKELVNYSSNADALKFLQFLENIKSR